MLRTPTTPFLTLIGWTNHKASYLAPLELAISVGVSPVVLPVPVAQNRQLEQPGGRHQALR